MTKEVPSDVILGIKRQSAPFSALEAAGCVGVSYRSVRILTPERLGAMPHE